MAYHPDGKRPPIVSPFYLQWERYPYLRGPNYVRPMFRENSRGGAFRAHPIERILPPAMSGLGEIPEACWDKPGFEKAHADCFELSRKRAKMFVSDDPSIDKSALIPCEPGMDEKKCIDVSFDACRTFTINKFKCNKSSADLDFGTGSKSSIAEFFKDKKTGQIDPLKAGLAILVAAIVVRQYKKGSK